MQIAASNNNDNHDLWEILMWICALAVMVFFTLVLTGCSSVQQAQQVVVRTDTVRQHQRDSIFIHFTDTVRERQRGDTIYIEQIKWRTAYREYLRTDTLVRTDSIATHQVVVEARMNSLQSAFFWVGIILTAALLLYIVWKVARWLK